VGVGADVLLKELRALGAKVDTLTSIPILCTWLHLSVTSPFLSLATRPFVVPKVPPMLADLVGDIAGASTAALEVRPSSSALSNPYLASYLAPI
jgi:hypothetical protein